MTPLRQRMLERHEHSQFRQNTQESYLQQVSSFARHFRARPRNLGQKRSAPIRAIL